MAEDISLSGLADKYEMESTKILESTIIFDHR